MYSAYEVCLEPGCNCDHRHGVWRTENASLVDAYRALYGGSGYESWIVGPCGERRVR